MMNKADAMRRIIISLCCCVMILGGYLIFDFKTFDWISISVGLVCFFIVPFIVVYSYYVQEKEVK